MDINGSNPIISKLRLRLATSGVVRHGGAGCGCVEVM